MSNNQKIDYVAQMEAIIRKNCLAKYSGLNVSAKEFIPCQVPSNFIQIKTSEMEEKELFDKLETDFVLQNAWLFE
jgi:hypothetical protein